MVLLVCISTVSAQDKFTISGHIRDSETGEELIGASIQVIDLKSGASSNVYGFYSVTIPGGIHTIKYSLIGYESFEFELTLTEDLRQDIELTVKPFEIKDVVVTAEVPDDNVELPEMSTIKMNPVKIKSIPIIFGEQDLMKTVQLMPGIKPAGEGQSGFFVRGGGADQNLILLDEATVYNSSHLLGFFSVFNSDAIKDVKLIKGSASAEYGGRLSSVMDIKMNDGNSKKYTAFGGIGLISSRLTLQGPLVKDKSSFIISGRRTYVDVFMKLSNKESVKNSTMYFYDLNLKTNYHVGPNDRLFLSGYFGRDVFGYKDEFGFDWGNATGTLRWNHLYSDRLFSNTSLVYSNYGYKLGLSRGNDFIDVSSRIKDFNLKEDLQYFANTRNTFKFGFSTTYHVFVPGEIIATEGSSVNTLKIKEKYALENALYLSHEYDMTPKLKLIYGLRYSGFSVLGPGDVFTFDEDGNATSVTHYKKGKLIKYYGGIEPRFSAKYSLNNSSSLKLSLTRNRQYLHLLSNTTSGNPFDIWHPSTKHVKPGISDQAALGYFRNLDHNNYETSVEVYYKDLKEQVDYKPGAELFLNELVEAELVFGKGRSYGAEFYFKKTSGKFTGWLSYTLSKTEKKFAEINNGEYFSARQDRTHDISVVGIYEPNQKWSYSAAWIYYTGNAVTFPSGKYTIDGRIINLYTERNGYRMPAYHRLDFGITIKGKKSSWNFSLYNAYGRRNAYSISFRANEDNPSITEAVRISLFSFFPSITYNFRW
jgi:hypothetical protein